MPREDLPSIEDFTKDYSNLPSIEEFITEEVNTELPSVKDYLEEEIQTIEDVEENRRTYYLKQRFRGLGVTAGSLGRWQAATQVQMSIVHGL